MKDVLNLKEWFTPTVQLEYHVSYLTTKVRDDRRESQLSSFSCLMTGKPFWLRYGMNRHTRQNWLSRSTTERGLTIQNVVHNLRMFSIALCLLLHSPVRELAEACQALTFSGLTQ